MKIKMTSIYVSDPNKAIKFYTEILGFKKLMHIPESDLAIVVSEEDENGTALLLEPNGNPLAYEYQEKVYNAGLPIIVFGSEDVKGEFKRLINLGVKFKQEPVTSEWGTTAIIDDTFGNLIQIHQD